MSFDGTGTIANLYDYIFKHKPDFHIELLQAIAYGPAEAYETGAKLLQHYYPSTNDFKSTDGVF